MKYLKTILACALVLFANVSFAEDTPAQVPIGIAVGPNSAVEVNFQNMSNTQGCQYNGAYLIDQSLDAETKKMMLSLLVSAKATNQRVRVRLDGCTDRPKVKYVFYEATWVGGF